ncbi:hypothetical protein [Romboutsia sp.]|uniref:hypothetical protein n=1 Tax=Romboutsia sp. TaxID=1965302 RepID=UPI003F4192E7
MYTQFNSNVEMKLKKLKMYEKHCFEWEMEYCDLYSLIYHRVVGFCKKNANKIQEEQNLRVDIDEYCSIALTDVLLKLVEDFDPYTDSGFMNLYYYRIKKAFINLYKKELTNKKKSLTTSIEWKPFYNDKYYTYIEGEESNLYIAIEEYIKINPKARLIYSYELDNREERTKIILKLLNKDSYGNSERQCVNRIKNGLKNYIKINNISI